MIRKKKRYHKGFLKGVFFILKLDLVKILMRANQLLGPLEGVGPENPHFFWPKWCSFSKNFEE
jgi:hypothetical protein